MNAGVHLPTVVTSGSPDVAILIETIDVIVLMDSDQHQMARHVLVSKQTDNIM